jgi:hypothetical protein
MVHNFFLGQHCKKLLLQRAGSCPRLVGCGLSHWPRFLEANLKTEKIHDSAFLGKFVHNNFRIFSCALKSGRSIMLSHCGSETLTIALDFKLFSRSDTKLRQWPKIIKNYSELFSSSKIPRRRAFCEVRICGKQKFELRTTVKLN